MNIEDYTNTDLKKILDALAIVEVSHGLYTTQCSFRIECKEELNRRKLSKEESNV